MVMYWRDRVRRVPRALAPATVSASRRATDIDELGLNETRFLIADADGDPVWSTRRPPWSEVARNRELGERIRAGR